MSALPSAPEWRVLLVDDHPITRWGIRLLLEEIESVEVVGEAEDGDDALRKARSLQPNLVLMDLNMPGTGGVEATRKMKEVFPDLIVLILTVRHEEGAVRQAVEAGAAGYLLKTSSLGELRSALASVQPGGMYLSPSVAATFVRSLSPASGTRRGYDGVFEQLSQRETEVLDLLAQGYSAKRIAINLGISERTVNSHVGHIYRKLNVSNRVEAVNAAIRLGLILPVGT